MIKFAAESYCSYYIVYKHE